MEQQPTLKFWIPFAGRNRAKLGTRIVLDPNDQSFYISRGPEKRRRGDLRIANSGKGLRQVFDVLSRFVAGYEELEQVFFNLCSDFMLSHQQCQRKVA